MTHLPYILAAYATTALLSVWLSLGAFLRLGRARRRLDAFESRSGRRPRS